MKRRLALCLTFLVSAACGSTTVPDASVEDAAPRADATARADAMPAADVPAAPDALPGEDAAAAPDAALDAGVTDAAEIADSGPADSGVDPCGPVPRAGAPARLEVALSSWLARCNPELSAAEAIAAARFVGLAGASALANPAITYDDVSAGACGCAIESAPCDRLAKLRTIAACDATLVSTATTGDECGSDFDCPTRHACVERPVAAGQAPGGVINLCYSGICQPISALDEGCGDGTICAPGLFCDLDADPAVCRAKGALGDDCSTLPCAGDDEDALLLGPNACYRTKAQSVCQALSRGPGATCVDADCHPLYQCERGGACGLAPGEGDACPTPYDVVTPDFDEQLDLVSRAQFSCRVPAFVGGNSGTYCTQTGTTTGVAQCMTLPTAGQACGLGQGLAPLCAGQAYCPGLETSNLAPFTSLCTPTLTSGSTCTPSLFDTNDPCGPAYGCYSDGKSTPVCTDRCDVNIAPPT